MALDRLALLVGGVRLGSSRLILSPRLAITGARGSRSNSANPRSIVNIKRPCEVVVFGHVLSPIASSARSCQTATGFAPAQPILHIAIGH